MSDVLLPVKLPQLEGARSEPLEGTLCAQWTT